MKTWNEIKAWRVKQRAALIGRREALSGAERGRFNEQITDRLEQAFFMLSRAVVGLCWPYRGEFDGRFIARRWRGQGAITALPEVTGKTRPLIFRKWWPGAPMRPGVYGIPVPDATPIVIPDALLVPMNAFDEQGYRIGYGGGYFDRTLAALRPAPLAIGVSFEMLRIETIYPQAHDVPMDFVVTEAALYGRDPGGLKPLGPRQAAERAQWLLAERNLPRAHTPDAREYASPACYAHEFPGYFGDGEDGK